MLLFPTDNRLSELMSIQEFIRSDYLSFNESNSNEIAVYSLGHGVYSEVIEEMHLRSSM